MASLSGEFNFVAHDSDGTPLEAARVYTYIPGTTTHKVAYTDAAAGTPHTYTSDGAGGTFIATNARGELPAPLFLTSGGYDITLKRSSGSTVWTRRAIGSADAGQDILDSLADDDDDEGDALITVVIDATGGATRTQHAKNADVINVRDFGTNANSSFTNACAELLARGGGDLIVPEGTYTFTSTTSISLPTKTRLLMSPGAILDFSGAAAATRIKTEGTLGSEVLLTSNVAVEDTVIPVASVSGLVAGDLLLISSDALVPKDAIGGVTTETLGEFVTIKGISGLNITINGCLDTAYLTADDAKIQKITPSEGVTVQGGKIIGFGISGADTSTLEVGVGALYARKFTVRDVQVEYCDYNGIRLDQVYDFLVDNCTVVHEERANAAHNNVIQYGAVMLGASSLGTVRGLNVINGKHGIAWSENSRDGVSRDVTITGCKIVGTWAAAVATHESNTAPIITDCDIISCARGIDIRVAGFTIRDVRVRNLPGSGSTADGVVLQEDARDGEIIDLKVDGCRYGIRGYNTTFLPDSTPSNIKIRGGWIRDAAQIGIYLEHTENANAKKGCTISDIDITDFAGDAIRINGEWDGMNIQNVRTRCASAPTGYGVRLMGTLNTRIKGCDFIGHVPVRLENDDQGSPVAPRNPILINNTWDHSTNFLSAAAGSDIVNQSNVEIGSASVTIASGAVTIPAGVVKIIIDTESAGASDDLDTISGGNTNDIIIIRAASDARTVVAKDATGNLKLAGDHSLTHTEDTLTLQYTGSLWLEVARSDSTA